MPRGVERVHSDLHGGLVIEENETLRTWLEEMRNEEQEARMEAHMAEEHEKAAIEAVASGLNYVDCAAGHRLAFENGQHHDEKKCSPRKDDGRRVSTGDLFE